MLEIPDDAPGVISWYQRYCRALVVLCCVVSLGGGYFVGNRSELAESADLEPVFFLLFGALWSLTMLFFAFVHFAALRTPRAPWAWTLHAVILGMGVTTLALWPFALPLLYFWFKPETKTFFGRSSSTQREP